MIVHIYDDRAEVEFDDGTTQLFGPGIEVCDHRQLETRQGPPFETGTLVFDIPEEPQP